MIAEIDSSNYNPCVSVSLWNHPGNSAIEEALHGLGCAANSSDRTELHMAFGIGATARRKALALVTSCSLVKLNQTLACDRVTAWVMIPLLVYARRSIRCAVISGPAPVLWDLAVS